jgi:hypothetical protein
MALLHVIDNLSNSVITGWNTLSQFRGCIDSDKKIVILKIHDKGKIIPTSISMNTLQTNPSTSQHKEDIITSMYRI